jgi:hypothetical protein
VGFSLLSTTPTSNTQAKEKQKGNAMNIKTLLGIFGVLGGALTTGKLPVDVQTALVSAGGLLVVVDHYVTNVIAKVEHKAGAGEKLLSGLISRMESAEHPFPTTIPPK